MKKIFGAAAILSAAGLPSQAEELTIDRLVDSPALSGPTVQGLKISPDGRRITFLRGRQDNQSQLDLWEFDREAGAARLLVDSATLLGGGPETLSEAEKARRERNRALTGKSGIVDYFWNDSGDSLLFPLSGDLFVLPVGGQVRRLTETDAFELDPKFSPKGRYVSFVRDGDLYAIELAGGREIRLTDSAGEGISNGVAEFIAQEELGRYTGYWWSPDENRIAFAQVDESAVDIKERYEVSADGGVTTIAQRYPAAGTTNATVTIGVVALDGSAPRMMEIAWPGHYLGRLNWTASGDGFITQILDRGQGENVLTLHTADGAGEKEFLTLGSDVWINLNNDLTPLADGTVLLTHEGTGYRHIYVFGRDGRALATLTSGDWVVHEVEHVDEAAGVVYFSGFRESPLELHLYSVPLAGGDITRITREPGWHNVTVAKGMFVDKFSSPVQPPQVLVRALDGGATIAPILENALDQNHPYSPYMREHAASRFGTIKAADGETDLYYRLYLPPDMKEGRRYSAIMAPYGGPHGQRVRMDWSLDFNQILARNGYVVMILDNRGMWNRGLAFESHVKNAMGTVEIADQVEGAAFLQSQSYVDGGRIGIWGWSYGGYMTLMSLFQEPDVFRAGAAVAPVTDWRLYDTAYTERYLGLPEAPGDVYEQSSVFAHIDGFRGDLLLIHGMADDNVFFDHSVKLIAALQNRRKPFELMTYPGKRHGIRGADARAHLWHRMFDFFERTLKAPSE